MNRRAQKIFEQKFRTYARITAKQIETLLLIRRFPNQKELCEIKGRTKSTISRMVKELERKGLVKVIVRGNSNECQLTRTGEYACSNFLSQGYFEGDRFIFRVHDLCFSCRILGNRGKTPKQVFVPVKYPYNSQRDVTVLFYPDSVQINLCPIYAYSVEFAMKCACRILVEVLASLEHDFPGLRFAKEKELGHLVRMHVAVPFHPLAVEFAKFIEEYGSTFVVNGRNITVDFSTGVPELEATSGIEAKAKLLKRMEFEDFISEGNNKEILQQLVEEKKSELDKNDANSEA